MDSSLIHYGVKGMKWGVRKDDEDGVHRFQSSEVKIESGLHKSTIGDARKVAGLIGSRYGFEIKNIKVLDQRHPHYEYDSLAFVEPNIMSDGRNAGTIFVQPRDMRKELKYAEEVYWNAPGTGNVKGLLTHESAHSIFHSDQTVSRGLLGGQKIKGGNAKARDKALKTALKVAKQDGMTVWDTSGYARTAGVREELEAEMFNQYHWGTNPSRFVQEWGKTLHREMGIDPTPFREMI